MIFTPSSSELAVIRRGVPKGARIGVTSGCFDLLHNLHLNYLQRCARLCDYLVVGVDSDDLVRATKGPLRPNIPEMQRVAMVDGIRFVDAAFVMGSVEEFSKVCRGLGAAYVFKNQAFAGRKVAGVGRGTKLCIVADINFPVSTTEIVEKIVNNSRLLGPHAGASSPSRR